MPVTAAADDFVSSFLGVTARVLGLAVLVIGAALAAMFAVAAAVVIGLLILGAAIGLRLTPRTAGGPDVLDARPTPNGWVVETRAKRK